MERRKFIESLFGGTAATVAASISNVNALQQSESFVAPKKSISHGLYVITYGEIVGSKDFPVRPQNSILTDGTLLWFVWPSEKGNSRGYVRPYAETNIENLDLIVHRIRQSKPEPPYYLYWQNGNYYMYKTPGSLVKRATYYLHKQGRTDEELLQCISDYRFATIINLVFCNSVFAENKMQELSKIDNYVRQYINNDSTINLAIQDYRTLLSETNIFS